MIVCYTDGSARSNGSVNSDSGFGVVVVDTEQDKVINAYNERCPGATNNQMEMRAILWAKEHYGTAADSFTSTIVYTDSAYCIGVFTQWAQKWRLNGWKRAKGQPVENLDLVKAYFAIDKKIDLQKVKGHAGVEYNEMADALAQGRINAEDLLDMTRNAPARPQ